MEATSSSLLSYIVLKGSDALAAESSAQLTAGDAMTSDYKPGKFFEIEDFSVGIKLDDDEPGEDASMAATEDRRSFARWRRISPQDAARGNDRVAPPFRSTPDEFELTRFIDSASPILIENCLDSKEFAKLVVVKRGYVFRASASGEELSGFLRFEFTKVRIKSISWEDGDAVRETYRFNFENVEVKYLRRSVAGKAGTEFRCEFTRAK